MAGRILRVLCCGLVILNLTACGARSSQSIMDEGMSQFGSGKTEESYHFINSGALLDELIDKYSGSYYQPTGKSMTDDEHEEAKKGKGSGDTSSDSTDTSTDSGSTMQDDTGRIPEVSDMTGLMRVFHDAYDRTSEYVEFKTTSGFSFDMGNDLLTIYTALQREDPIDVSGVGEWSTWNSGNEYYVSISYLFDIDELKSMKKETTQLVSDAVKELDIAEKNEYEIVCTVNDYLCDNVYYPASEPYEPVTHTAYGALKNGCAVCEGYACAAKLLLNGCGVECDIEVGDCYNGGGHAWNLVKVSDQWYQLDVTWNDGSASRSDYLLVTDDYMRQSRAWEESNYPACTSEAYMT